MELRGKAGLERKEFGELTGWSYHTQFRLEQDKTPFKRAHLEALIAAGWIKEGDEWCQRFEAAIAYQWERHQQDEQEDVARPKHSTDQPENVPGAVASATHESPNYALHPDARRTVMAQNGVVVWQGNAIPVNAKSMRWLAGRVINIKQAGEVARSAVDEISDVYGYAEFKVITTLSAEDTIRKAAAASREISPAEQAALDLLRQAFLQRIAQITDHSGGITCLLADGIPPSGEPPSFIQQLLGG